MVAEETVPFKNLEYWVLAQVGLEVALILLLLFFLVKIRSMAKLLKTSQEAEQSVAGEFARLSEQMASLEKKQVALEETLALLSGKGLGLREQLSSSGPEAAGTYASTTLRPEGSSLRLQVEDLHLQGFSPTEIARRLGLHPTEVKMALDLSRLKAESP